MISIRNAEVDLDYVSVLRRSQVANVPTAREHLKRFIDISSVYVIDINGEIAGLYGLKPPTILSGSWAYLWLLTTDVVDSHKFEFVRYSEVVIENILKEYEKIIGDTHVNDARGLKWVKWLGAVYGMHRGDLAPFYITRESFKGRRRWRTQ